LACPWIAEFVGLGRGDYSLGCVDRGDVQRFDQISADPARHDEAGAYLKELIDRNRCWPIEAGSTAVIVAELGDHYLLCIDFGAGAVHLWSWRIHWRPWAPSVKKGA
jgi:hypothetical protein